MQSQTLNTEHLQQATSALTAGEIIAYPTEAVFGLGCLPDNESAIQRIFELKQRPNDKGLIIVAASMQQILPYAEITRHVKLPGILQSWPGPVTWLLPVKASVSGWITGGSEMIAVRVSAHPIIQAICQQVGAITSTSANLSNEPPAKTAQQVESYFQGSINVIVPGETGGLEKPTEIRHGLTGEIIRPGP